MALTIIEGPNQKFIVLDGSDLILLDGSQVDVEKYFLEEFRKRFWKMAPIRKADPLEYEVLSGKISCCDCGKTVTVYNPSWKKENQRCEQCKR